MTLVLFNYSMGKNAPVQTLEKDHGGGPITEVEVAKVGPFSKHRGTARLVQDGNMTAFAVSLVPSLWEFM